MKSQRLRRDGNGAEDKREIAGFSTREWFAEARRVVQERKKLYAKMKMVGRVIGRDVAYRQNMHR